MTDDEMKTEALRILTRFSAMIDRQQREPESWESDSLALTLVFLSKGWYGAARATVERLLDRGDQSDDTPGAPPAVSAAVLRDALNAYR